MTTRIVNVAHGEPFDVYVGGPGKKAKELRVAGYFGNPFAPLFYSGAVGRAQCLDLYRRYLLFRVKTDLEFLRQALALRGKTLACHCAPRGGLTTAAPHVCHAQVLGEVIDGYPVSEMLEETK